MSSLTITLEVFYRLRKPQTPLEIESTYIFASKTQERATSNNKIHQHSHKLVNFVFRKDTAKMLYICNDLIKLICVYTATLILSFPIDFNIKLSIRQFIATYWLCKCIIPEYSGSGIVVLATMNYHYHRKRQSLPEREKKP